MVKKGYKQTEVGVIPEDWETSSLSAAFQKLEAGVSVNSNNSLSSEYHILKTSAVHDGVVDTAETKPVIPQDYLRLKCPLVKGSIIISRMNTPALVGECGFTKDAKPGTYLPDRLWQIQNFNKNNFHFAWLNYLLNTKQYRDAVRATATGTSNSMKNISKERMLDIKIPLPPISEQEDIAAALSEVDELINLVDKQISKKKVIKQGAMQELLTGKRRLPGFNGVWQEVKLEDICSKVTDGAHESPPESDVGYYMPSVKDMRSTGFNYSECKKISYSDFKKLERNGCRPNVGDVLIAKDGSILKYAFVQEKAENIVILSSIAIITPHPNCVNSYFLAQYFKQQNFVEQVITNYKSGTGVPRIVLKGFKQIVLFIPESVAEQAAVAKILVDMDTEITGLENELAKYRQVKQCMMQQLLTGKIRLKNDVEDLVQAEQADAVKTLPARTAHNHQFDDAVSIAAIVDTFYSDKYPLGRVKVQKLLYLLHRHQSVSVSDFKKKAAGPYADAVRYKGGEPIAIKNKYVVSESGKQGTRYARGANMAQALNYVERWGMQTDLQWLKENFLHTSRNDLELFATVDMAMSDLAEAGISASVESIKNLIASNKEWKAKLFKTYFSDRDIARAIKKCTDLFD